MEDLGPRGWTRRRIKDHVPISLSILGTYLSHIPRKIMDEHGIKYSLKSNRNLEKIAPLVPPTGCVFYGIFEQKFCLSLVKCNF